MDPARAYLASKLRDFRKKANMNVDYVGSLIGRSGKTVSAWEVGRGQPDADRLVALCNLYKVGISDFYPPDIARENLELFSYDEHLDKEVGNGLEFRMKSMRKEKGLTQKELGQLVGVSERQIRYWEQGASGEHLSFSDAVRIANAFDCSLDVLAGNDCLMKTNLQKMRKAAGFKSAEAFAESIGISKDTYTGYEQGRIDLKLKKAWEFADALNCSLDELAGRDWPAKDVPDLSPGEAELLETYRSASDMGQRSIETTARAMAKEFPRDKGDLEPPVELRA